MSVMIRMTRAGKKNDARFEVIVKNKHAARDGGYIERLGYYNPHAKNEGEKLVVNRKSLDAWVAKGAQVSETLKKLMKSAQDKVVRA